MKRARLIPYAKYQLVDFVLERGIMVLILSVLNLSGLVISILSEPPEERARLREASLGTDVLILFPSLIMLAVLFASQELISRPRKLSYYRLVFAKPVSPVRYYSQLFVVHLVGTVAFVTLLTALFSVIALPMYLPGIAALTAIGFVLVGGIGFLLSAITNYDSMATIALIAVAFIGNALSAKYSGFLVTALSSALPLEHVFALKPLLLGTPVGMGDVAWVLAYGLTAFALGLVALRFTQLSD
jgi:hypothetical protein